MPINIDYTTIDYDALKDELINYLKETKTFKDVEYANSNINTLVQLYAYLGSLFGYYINSIANEPFLPSAKRYKNLNRIARLLAYSPRGTKSASLQAVGSLLPEYCFGKEDVFFEIPAYSSFPSNKPTPDNENFVFTNEDHVVYQIKSYGVRTVEQNDFTYDGSILPLTKPASFWTVGTTATPSFDPTKLVLNLSDTLPLSILDRLNPNNYKKFDVANVPLFDPTDSTSVGQPFNRNISTNSSTLRIKPSTVYYIVFNYDKQTSTPYLTILEEGVILEQRRDDIITSIRLDKEDEAGNFYTLKQVQNNSKGRFYVGVMGLRNLEAVSFSFDKLESTTNGIKQIHMDINKTGDKPPLEVLVDGVVYTFKQGRISSQIFDVNSWDVSQPFYNIVLTIVSPDAPDYNYDATLTVTSKDPGVNEITIAKIYPSYVDPATQIKAAAKDPGQRFGNLQAVPVVDVSTTEQKTGRVTIPNGVQKVYVAFDTPFTETEPGENIDYILEMTPSDSVQLWYSDKSENGFTINIEENTGFDGTVDWIATRFKEDAVRTTDVSFDTPFPQIDGQNVDYTIFLTPSDNVQVWYSDKSENGFKINTAKSFSGTVSYSTFVFSNNQEVLVEKNSSTQRKGSVTFEGSVTTKDIAFDGEFDDVNYGLHMIANQNVNVWYTNKTTKGFTINVQSTFTGQLVVDWFADFSPLYEFQRHGTVNFAGQVTTAGTIPGIRFANTAETFLFPELKQGNIKFSYINRNGVIDQANNNLNIQFSADRRTVEEVKFQILNDSVSYTDIRVFVKNEADEWEEWGNGTSLVASVDVSVGNKVFFVQVDEYAHTEVSFGDGIAFGLDPKGKEIIVFGLESVGKAGNVPPNTVGPSIVLAQQILGDDNITIQFEEQFIQLIGLKTANYFSADTQSSNTIIYDSEGTTVGSTELSVLQPTPANGGSDVETTEELRANASLANLRQDRVVSKEDYVSYVNQAFSDYIFKSQVLSYRELEESGFLPPGDLEKYWFNYVFIIALPKYGNVITKNQRDYILNTLNNRFKAMETVEHELFSAKLIPIDIRIRVKPTKTGSPESIQNTIKTLIKEYFNRDKHEMGETVEYGPIEKLVLNVVGVQNAELAFNKNVDNKLSPNDYITEGVTSSKETVEDVKRRKVLEVLAKDPSIFNVIDPLFSVKDTTTNKTKWVFSANLELNKFEFPILGNIIIEMES
jgi:hypothetical protein